MVLFSVRPKSPVVRVQVAPALCPLPSAPPPHCGSPVFGSGLASTEMLFRYLILLFHVIFWFSVSCRGMSQQVGFSPSSASRSWGIVSVVWTAATLAEARLHYDPKPPPRPIMPRRSLWISIDRGVLPF